MTIKQQWNRLVNRAKITLSEMTSKKSEPKQEYNSTPMGAPGTRIYSGVISEEYHRELNSITKAYDIYNRMRYADGACHSLLQAVLLPIMGAKYDVKAASDDLIHQEHAELVRHNYFEGMSNSWEEHLAEAFTFQPFGYSLFEKLWHEKGVDWSMPATEGNKKAAIKKGFKMYKKFAFRSQRTLEKWLFDETGGFKGFKQKAKDPNGKDVNPELVVPNILVFTNQKEGDNFQGVSMYRPSFKHWKVSDEVREIDIIGIEKNALGQPYIQEVYIEGKAGVVTPDDRDKALENLEALQAHEEMAHYIPRTMELRELEGKMNTDAIQNSLRHHTTMMAMSILADFMLLGVVADKGAQSLGDTKIDFFYKSLTSKIDTFLRVHNQYAIPALIDANYTVIDGRYPKLICLGLTQDDLRAWAETLGTIATTSFLPPYPELSTHIAEKLDLPAPSKTDLINVRWKSNSTGQEPPPASLPPQLRERSWRFSEEAGSAEATGRQLAAREKALGLDEQGVIALREAQEKIEQAFLSKVKPVYASIKKSLNEQSNKGVDSNDLAVPDKLRLQYKALLKDAYLNSERNGALSVRREMKKAPGKDMAAVLEAKAEEAAAALADKDCQDLVYFARLEIARRIGRKLP